MLQAAKRVLSKRSDFLQMPHALFTFFALLSWPSSASDAPSARYSSSHASSLASSSPVSLEVVTPTPPAVCETFLALAAGAGGGGGGGLPSGMAAGAGGQK